MTVLDSLTPTEHPLPPQLAVPCSAYDYVALAEIYNQGRVDYIVPMPMNARRLEEYVRAYDVDLAASLVAVDGVDNLPNGLLTHICVPTRPGLRLDYDRTLRPILTQALALDAGGNGHIVTATEHVAPRVAVVAARQPQSPFSTARFGDPVTSDVYINRVAGVLASRQFERLTKSAA